MGLCQRRAWGGEGQAGGQMRYVLGDRGRSELRTRLSNGSGDTCRARGVPDGRPVAAGRRLMASKTLRQATSGRERASEHEGFLRYQGYKWLKIALISSAIALLIYAFNDVQPKPNGGSIYGYFTGTIGVALILWLTMLGVRKRSITPGRWSL